MDTSVDEFESGVVAEFADAVVAGIGADWLTRIGLGDKDWSDFKSSCIMMAGVWLFGAALVNVQLDFSVVAVVGDWLCRVSLACNWPSEVEAVLPADWLGEAALVDDWLPCPAESAWILCKALAGD